MDRRARLAAFAAVPLLAGCAHFGLDPFPDPARLTRRPAAPAPVAAPKAPDGKTALPGAKPPGPAAPAKAPEPPPPPPPATLRLKFEKGASQRAMVTADTTVNLAAMGMNIVTKSELEFSQEVLEAREDGTGVVSVSLVGIRGSTDNPFMGSVKYDSRDPDSVKKAAENPMLAQAIQALTAAVGKPLALTLSASGEVKEQKASGEASEGISTALAGGSIGSLFTGVAGDLPQDALAAGLTWAFRQESSGPLGGMTLEGTARIDAWDEVRKLATILYSGTISIKPNANPDPGDMQAQVMAAMKLKSSEVKGETVFDQGRGRLLSNKSKTKMVMDNPMAGGEMSIDVASETKFVP